MFVQADTMKHSIRHISRYSKSIHEYSVGELNFNQELGGFLIILHKINELILRRFHFFEIHRNRRIRNLKHLPKENFDCKISAKKEKVLGSVQ